MSMWPNDKLNNATDDPTEVRQRGIQRKQVRRVIRPANKLRTQRRATQRRGGTR